LELEVEVTMQEIFWYVGVGLLILAGLAGLALFFRAILSDADEKKEEGRRSTLWGLFLVGLIAGLIVLAISRAL
jgi:hypothetical protein